MKVILTVKVVTGTNKTERLRTTQPSNQKWVTVIEAICAQGFAIPALVIFETIMHQAA